MRNQIKGQLVFVGLLLQLSCVEERDADPSFSLPEVVTSEAFDRTVVDVTIGGIIVMDGGEQISEKGVHFSKDSIFTADDPLFFSDESGSDFKVLVGNLKANTTYFYRAFAANSSGKAYGKMLEVTTAASLPEPPGYPKQ